jgi:purine nucleosidase
MITELLLDVDTGVDDALAILFALRCPGRHVRAITCVSGNVGVEQVVANTLKVLDAAGTPPLAVARGAAAPLSGRVEPPSRSVHGADGLADLGLPPSSRRPAPGPAAELLRRELLAAPEPPTLVACGPLTNVALLLRTHTELSDRIADIVVMGGSMGPGNVTPFAEFNIWVDPEAADVVFTSGVPVTLCGLDVTHQALATADVLERLGAIGSRLATTTVELLVFFRDRYREGWGMDAPPVHDPVAVARVLDPALVRCVDAHVAIELHGTHTRGATVCDRYGVLGRVPNAQVAVELDVARFWDVVIDAVARLG